MILNAYAVLVGFVAALRLFAAVLVAELSVSALWRCAGHTSLEARRFLEDRGYLLFLLAFLLLVLNVSSWPLFYLLLQSYVPEWPGAMCIYGVTQVGTGSQGPARSLPTLVEILQWSKPFLVFLTGSWFVLYAMNRRTQTAPLTNRVLLALTLLGVVAVADAVVEGAYLVIPKKEEFPNSGCCTAVFAPLPTASRLPRVELAVGFGTRLQVCYYAVNLARVLTLAYCLFRPRWEPSSVSLLPMLLGSLVTLAAGKLFLRELAAPALLHLPYHRCVYDLIARVPESVVGIGLFFLGSFAVGWTCVLGWFANCPETMPMLRERHQELLRLGLFGYLGSVVMVSVALALG